MTRTRSRPEAPGLLYRDFAMSVDSAALATRAEGDGRIPISLSSEYPVERTDWWEGERYLEVLDHSPASVDLSRAADGLPFLLDHDSRQQIGLIEDVRVDPDRTLRGLVRFSRAQAAQEIRADMLDGIRKNISVGYSPDMNNVVRSQGDGEPCATERIMRWTPMEGSSVPIPADPTVGVGRSAVALAIRSAAKAIRTAKPRGHDVSGMDARLRAMAESASEEMSAGECLEMCAECMELCQSCLAMCNDCCADPDSTAAECEACAAMCAACVDVCTACGQCCEECAATARGAMKTALGACKAACESCAAMCAAGATKCTDTAAAKAAAGEDEARSAEPTRLQIHLAGTPGAENTNAARTAEETTMSQETAAPTAAATITAGEDLAARKEREDGVRALCELHKIPTDRAEVYVRSGMSGDGVASLIVAEARRTLKGMTESALDLSAHEERTFSVSRAVLAQIQRIRGEKNVVDDGFEREIDVELRRDIPEKFQKGGIMIPARLRPDSKLLGRTIDTQASTGAKGGNLIFKQPADYLDFLWPRMRVAQLGATRLAGLQGPLAFPKMTSYSSWTWTGDGGTVTDSDPVWAQVALDPKVGQSTTGFTRGALVEASSGNVDLEAKVQNQLFQTCALGIDAASINGPGGNAPTGILQTALIGDVADGSGNGSVPTRADFIALMTAVAAANADIGPGGWLSTPGIRGVAMNLFATTGGTPVGLPVWDRDQVLGETALVSTQVPSTLSAGTASAICHAIIYGIWQTLNVGYWGAYELVVDPYSAKKQGIIEVTNYQIAGVALEYPSAFAAKQDAKLS